MTPRENCVPVPIVKSRARPTTNHTTIADATIAITSKVMRSASHREWPEASGAGAPTSGVVTPPDITAGVARHADDASRLACGRLDRGARDDRRVSARAAPPAGRFTVDLLLVVLRFDVHRPRVVRCAEDVLDG